MKGRNIIELNHATLVEALEFFFNQELLQNDVVITTLDIAPDSCSGCITLRAGVEDAKNAASKTS